MPSHNQTFRRVRAIRNLLSDLQKWTAKAERLATDANYPDLQHGILALGKWADNEFVDTTQACDCGQCRVDRGAWAEVLREFTSEG